MGQQNDKIVCSIFDTKIQEANKKKWLFSNYTAKFKKKNTISFFIYFPKINNLLRLSQQEYKMSDLSAFNLRSDDGSSYASAIHAVATTTLDRDGMI